MMFTQDQGIEGQGQMKQVRSQEQNQIAGEAAHLNGAQARPAQQKCSPADVS